MKRHHLVPRAEGHPPAVRRAASSSTSVAAESLSRVLSDVSSSLRLQFAASCDSVTAQLHIFSESAIQAARDIGFERRDEDGYYGYKGHRTVADRFRTASMSTTTTTTASAAVALKPPAPTNLDANVT